MERFLETTLHQKISLQPYSDIKKLPLAYRNAFTLHLAQIQQQFFVLARPNEDMSLTELRKSHLVLERHTGQHCALYLTQMTFYAKEEMIKAGIPFVWENHQIYLPFLGVLLATQAERSIKSCSQISFMTQKLLLKALYDNWQDVSGAKAAELLEVSRMSITRCFDEIQGYGLPFITGGTRSRRFCSVADKREMWELLRPALRDPVTEVLWLGEGVNTSLPLAGVSALSEYSMLGEEPYPTYAATTAQIRQYQIRERKTVPEQETPVCVVQRVGYILPFADRSAIDPLSLALSLTENERNDPRVELAVNQMLEDYVW